ncbi:Gfo/Idh/MocA family protein [Paenibacillus glycanilyticus]|uniref:Oxidoreductase n=1 Tax=Paenibacillus glycanilyticus TaxID=126569 RepID=A0ABQ6GFA8_9BACL|nr:Gfo/Idh/MocA family oxidoreductase [Paenibacillus glycanilyticus]GLX68888.1 oxidoreductase [Paenibacillus glycanilyticus]
MMNKQKIGVGIIGASPSNPYSWAVNSHIPSIKALADEYELRAVSTSRQSTAKDAEKKYGVPGFDNHLDLINHAGVDLVVVTVKVPYHHEIITAALDAGKMVFSEWPLGNGLDEAKELAKCAETAGTRTIVGLQARYSPVIRYARDLISEGYVGDVLGTTLVGSGMGWTGVTDRLNSYVYDKANGVTVLSVPIMHTLDALQYVLGDFSTISAEMVSNQTESLVADTNIIIPFTSPNHVSIVGTLTNGTAVSVFYRGGTSRGENMRWEINGTKGDLVITAPSGHTQLAELKLQGGRNQEHRVEDLTVPEYYYGHHLPTGIPSNTARIYEHFAKDLRDGTYTTPDFAHALRQHKLLSVIETASQTGMRQNLSFY